MDAVAESLDAEAVADIGRAGSEMPMAASAAWSRWDSP